MKTTSTIKLIILSLNLFVYCMASANVVYVDLSATGSSDGTSWLNADTSLKHAITTSTANDTIKIAKGTYKEGSEIVIDKALTLIGGYDNGGSPTPSSSNITQISGDNTHRVIRTVNTQGTYIYFFSLEIIEGRNDSEGAGIYNDGAALAFVNCKIKNNEIINNHLGDATSLKGAGIYSEGGSVFISHSMLNHNLIERNWVRSWFPSAIPFPNYTSSYYGAGIYASNTAVGIYNSTVQNNTIQVIVSCKGYDDIHNSNNFFGAGIAILGKSLNIANSSLDSNIMEINISAQVIGHRNSGIYSRKPLYNNSKIIGAIIYSYDCDLDIKKSTISSNGTTAQLTNSNSGYGIPNLFYSNIIEGGVIRNRNGSLKITECSIINNSVNLKERFNQSTEHRFNSTSRTSKILGGVVLYEGARAFQIIQSKLNSNNLTLSNLNLSEKNKPQSNSIVEGNVIATAGPDNHIVNTEISENNFSSNSNSKDTKYSCVFKGQILSAQELHIQNSLISKNSANLNSRYKTFNGTTINSLDDVALLSSTVAANSGNVLTNQINQAITSGGKYTCYNSIVSHNKNDGNELNVGSVGSTDIKYSFIRGQNYSGTGNFNGTGNPGFLDSNSNYTLRSTSMLLEAGNTALLPVDAFDTDEDNNTTELIDTDLAGNPRIGKCEVDLGAYESFGSTTGIIYVDSAATGSNNGYSWANAFTDLQDALNLRMTCSKVDTILIAEGTYYPTQTLPGSTDPRTKCFLLQDSNVVLIGGYKASSGSRTGKASILSGDIGTKNNKSDNSYHVLIHTFLDSTTHFQHLTIQDGNATSSTPFIVPNTSIIIHNAGGGICGRRSTLKLSNIKLINNHANGNGGGIDYLGSDCDANHLLFENNNADQSGGGIYIAGLIKTSIRNSTFKGNSSDVKGGGLSGSGLKLENCYIEGNNASEGGGVSIENGNRTSFINRCYFSENNKSPNETGGDLLILTAVVQVNSCIFDEPLGGIHGVGTSIGIKNRSDGTFNNCVFNSEQANAHSTVFIESSSTLNLINCSFLKTSNVVHIWNEGTVNSTNTAYFNAVDIDLFNRNGGSISTNNNNASASGSASRFKNGTGFIDIQNSYFKDILKDSSDLDGPDNLFGTADDGADLILNSPLQNAGTNTGAATHDVLGRFRENSPSIGAYQGPGSCSFNSAIPISPGLFTSSSSNIANGYLCFCDANDKLLLALDTTGTGAVIPANGVQLKIGNNPTTSWINSGGIVTNSKGGAIFNRQWEVTPTVQPNNPVKVKYFFTNAEYLSLKDTLANHNNGASGYPTIINSPSEINMYKITSSGTFVDPHSNSAAGIILVNGTTPSLTEWKYSSKGTDHCAEYLVSSFSGGGGGFGGGFSPLPVDLITFTANYIGNHTAQLNWTTASETNNSHFRIERSYDGVEFEKIGRVEGNGNHNSILNYQFLDPKLDGNKTIAYYRLIQVDFNGNENKTNIQIVKFQDASLISPIVYPNPFVNEITVSNLSQEADITLINSLGQTISEWKSNTNSKTINLDHVKSGMYYIQITQNDYTVSYKITKY